MIDSTFTYYAHFHIFYYHNPYISSPIEGYTKINPGIVTYVGTCLKNKKFSFKFLQTLAQI